MMITLFLQRQHGGERRFPAASLLLGSLALPIFFLAGGAAAFEYGRDALAGGELWRLVTCHWTHYTPSMLLWDGLAFVALGAACEMRDRRRFLIVLGAAALLIPAALWVALPGMGCYRGLSGLDSALFGLLAAMMLREGIAARDRRRIASVGLFALLFVGKAVWETAQGSTVFADLAAAGAVPCPLAHGVGLVVGIVVGIVPGRCVGIVSE